MKKQLTSLEKQEINEVLQRIGFSKNEQAVYLALLPFGQTTLTPFSRTLGFPATTVQSILNRLHQEGVVTITKRKSRQVYEALEPKVFKKITESRLQEISGIIPLLETLQSDKQSGGAKIKIFYRERAADIFLSALEAKNKTIYEIVAAAPLQKIIGEKLHFSKRRRDKGVRLKSLRVETHEIKRYNQATHLRELREAKFLPRELSFQGTIMMWDSTVAFFSTKEEGLAWTVESPVIATMFRQLFDMLWSISRPMVTA